MNFNLQHKLPPHKYNLQVKAEITLFFKIQIHLISSYILNITTHSRSIGLVLDPTWKLNTFQD